MENLHSEITCPYCRMGFGALKQFRDEFSHLDIFWSRESGLQRTCENQQLLKDNLLSVDDNQNPTFNEEFNRKLTELREKFENNPDDINKDNTEWGAYFVAFIECLNYGSLDDDDDHEYDRSGMSGEAIMALYDKGLSVKDALLSFLKPSNQST